jgi:hypothetical protein
MATSVENAASKAVGNTALGLSIGALGVELLNGGLQRVMGNLFGGGCNNQCNNGCSNCGNYGAMGAGYEQYEIDNLRDELWQGALSLTKGIYDTRLTDINEKYQMREKDVAEKFSLYKYSTDAMAGLQNEISGLKTKMAVMEAIQPFKDQLIANAINLEAERRACADGKIVCYSNATFMPLSVVGATPDTTNVTQRTIFNPLCNCCA